MTNLIIRDIFHDIGMFNEKAFILFKMILWYFYFKLMAEMFKLEHIWWINKNFKSLTEPKFLLEIVTQNKPCTKYYKDRITRIFNYFNRVCDSIEVPDDVIAMCMVVHKETINAVSLCSCTRAVLPDLVKKISSG